MSEGDTVAVVSDGAGGLSGVLAPTKLGASRIIVLSRNPARQAVAKELGATDIVEERGQDAIDTVLRLTEGAGIDAALECVGTDQSIETCAGIVRAGSNIGAVGVPLYEKFPELLDDVLAGRINPGLEFDLAVDLDDVTEAYAAMDERRAIKSLLRVSDI